MNLDKKGTLKLLGIIFASILFFAAVTHLGVVLAVFGKVLAVMAPLFIGLGLAMIINLPLRFFECKVFKKLTYSKNKAWKKLKRPICLTISVLIVLAFLTVIIVIIAPQFIDAIKRFVVNLPGYMDALNGMLHSLLDKFHISTGNLTVKIDWETISAKALELLNQYRESIANITISAIKELASGVFNTIFGFVFAIYILASKESLSRMGRRFVFSIFSADKAKYVLKVARLSNKAFGGFITGQLLEAITIGVLCFIGMLILKMPYPLLVSVIIAVTAIVPIFGPIFGTIVGAFIILLDTPMQAVWFVVYILILQQIESNVIYPKIMGKSVSLPGLWVLFAVTTFGGLWGVLGIIVSIPICSVAYTLFDSWLSKRLIERNIANHQYEQEHPKDYDQSFFKFKKKNKAEKQNTDQETDSPCAKDSASEDNN